MSYTSEYARLAAMRLMLSAYKTWKHPKYYDKPSDIQNAKERFYKCKKLYLKYLEGSK